MRRRSAARILVPLAALALAGVLGTFAIGRHHVAASSSLMANPGISLADAGSAVASPAQLARGRILYEANCSSCHSANAGGSAVAPNLRGRGAGVVDLWLSTGWMPLAEPTAQPENKPPRFDRRQILDIAAFVSSLAPGGLEIPTAAQLDLSKSSVENGFTLYSLNCAPCHTITGAGDALTAGYHAPPLHGVTAREIYEAVRSGPSQMPHFGPGNISPAQLTDIINYVTSTIEHPVSPGGLGLGGVGPVAEGFVGLFAGVGVCMLAAFWVGDRTEHDDEQSDDGDGGHGDGSGHGTDLGGAHA
ncbi:MAG: cytochrome bc1 complex diheme cytochrome c subunit [Acidimicrobiales bacterium]